MSTFRYPPSSTGIAGPVSSTDNAVARFDGTGGATLQNSVLVVDDSGNVTGAANITGTGATLSGLTASKAVVTDGSKNLASSAVTSTELGYVSGVTSAIQTQINSKQSTITGGATTITSANLAVSQALVSDGSGKVATSSTTATELGYVNGVTSAIQTQLNGKQASGTYIKADGTVSMAATLNLGTNKITNVVDPTASQDAATKAYVDAGLAALNPADAVFAASSGSNIANTYNNGVAGVGAFMTVTATGAFTIDGTSPALNARILIKNQTNGFENGVYNLTVVGSLGVSPVLTRALDYNTASDMNTAGLIPVINGTVNALTSWQQTSTITTVGSDNLTFSEFTANPSLYVLKANNLSDVASTSTSFNNLSPMSASGDTIYGGASGAGTRLAGNITTTKKFLTQTGNGSISAAPGWNTIVAGDVPTLNQNTTGTASNVTGTVAILNGGTGQTTKAPAFDALQPMTTLGDTIYGGASGTGTALAGNTTTTLKALTQTGNGSASAAPVWTSAVSTNTNSTIVARDGSGNFSAGTITATLTGTASGNTTYTANNHGVVVSGSANAMTVVAPNASTAFPLISGGASADPAWAKLSEAGGGTNQTTYTTGDILYASASNTLSKLTVGSSNQVLTVSGGVPTWAAASSSASADYLELGERKIDDLTGLKILGAYFTSGSKATFRTSNASSGYAVTGGKTLEIYAVQIHAAAGSAATVTLAYADNDLGFNSVGTFTNPVYQFGDSSFNFFRQPGTAASGIMPGKPRCFSTFFTIPAGKYVQIYQASGGGNSIHVVLYGKEV